MSDDAKAIGVAKEVTKEVIYEDPRHRYTLANVIDAVKSGDVAMVVDAARLYPALVTSLIVDPLAVMRSLYGHKKARRPEYLLRNLFYLDRKEEIERFKRLTEGGTQGGTLTASKAQGNPQEAPSELLMADQPPLLEEDEASALLARLKSDLDDLDADEEE